jgi:hypothetical protein
LFNKLFSESDNNNIIIIDAKQLVKEKSEDYVGEAMAECPGWLLVRGWIVATARATPDKDR